jgi:hypothetical protein
VLRMPDGEVIDWYFPNCSIGCMVQVAAEGRRRSDDSRLDPPPATGRAQAMFRA